MITPFRIRNYPIYLLLLTFGIQMIEEYLETFIPRNTALLMGRFCS